MSQHIKSMTLPELSQVLKELGQPAFRAKQVYTWLHKGVRSYDQMSNIPQALREKLAQLWQHVRKTGKKLHGRRIMRISGTFLRIINVPTDEVVK